MTYTILTIKRPSGDIEEVKMDNSRMNDKLFARIKEATKVGGRGDVMNYKVHEPEYKLAPRAKNQPCPRCGTWCYGDCTAR